MKKRIVYILIFCFASVAFCFADETSSDLPNVIDFNRIPNLKGEKYPPDIIIFSEPGSAARLWVSGVDITSENYIDVYVAVWYRDGRIIWSDRNSKKEDYLPPTTYYESYLTLEQLDDFWKKYRKIEAWNFFNEGFVTQAGPNCYICVSARWSRNELSNTLDHNLNDSCLAATDFAWPTLDDYGQYYVNKDAMEAWLRLRHNILVLIPHRPKEIREREKIGAVFYFPSYDNSSTNVSQKNAESNDEINFNDFDADL